MTPGLLFKGEMLFVVTLWRPLAYLPQLLWYSWWQSKFDQWNNIYLCVPTLFFLYQEISNTSYKLIGNKKVWSITSREIYLMSFQPCWRHKLLLWYLVLQYLLCKKSLYHTLGRFGVNSWIIDLNLWKNLKKKKMNMRFIFKS